MRLYLLALMLLPLSLQGGCATPPAPETPPNPWTTGVRFAPMGGAEKAEAAYLSGSGSAVGLYTIRVRIGANGGIAPHTHPDARILTVVSGEVWYGFGESVDLSKAKLYRTGDVFLVPAGAPHWSKTEASEAVYQEAGMGPTALTPIR